MGSVSLSHPDAFGPVARQDQDGWGRIRMQELQEGDKCAIQLHLGLHSGFVLGLLSLLVTQSRGPYRALSAGAS